MCDCSLNAAINEEVTAIMPFTVLALTADIFQIIKTKINPADFQTFHKPNPDSPYTSSSDKSYSLYTSSQ